jgi:hypothetical protein
MRIIAILMIFSLAACATVHDRSARQGGVGFSTYDDGTSDGG